MESSLDIVSNNGMVFGTGIDWNNTEIEKNATMLIRLLGLLEAGTLSPTVFNNIAKKYSSKLEGSLGLWKQYYNIQEREADIYGSELNRAMEQNATLTARQRIGDITTEEYDLKQAMIQWDIENNKAKAKYSKENLDKLNKLPDTLDKETRESIKQIATTTIETEIEPELSTTIMQSFTLLDEIIK